MGSVRLTEALNKMESDGHELTGDHTCILHPGIATN